MANTPTQYNVKNSSPVCVHGYKVEKYEQKYVKDCYIISIMKYYRLSSGACSPDCHLLYLDLKSMVGSASDAFVLHHDMHLNINIFSA